ncbi:MAG TPA: hypothetical protein VK285_03140 [Gaiellaceae bacterium]|nr:hypothetical protein [Gaiellaceae bacterium]
MQGLGGLILGTFRVPAARHRASRLDTAPGRLGGLDPRRLYRLAAHRAALRAAAPGGIGVVLVVVGAVTFAQPFL